MHACMHACMHVWTQAALARERSKSLGPQPRRRRLSTQPSGMRKCQKRPICMAKEAYAHEHTSGLLVLVGLFCLIIGLFCLIIGLF
jgi:hypothetical protein